uniref:hypothetical protein n=1 Tax=Amycolatopsis sp. CA-096443 TaxID=3239919 RepID=UPI003F49AF90
MCVGNLLNVAVGQVARGDLDVVAATLAEKPHRTTRSAREPNPHEPTPAEPEGRSERMSEIASLLNDIPAG